MFSEHFSSILFQKKKKKQLSVLYLQRLRKLLQEVHRNTDGRVGAIFVKPQR